MKVSRVLMALSSTAVVISLVNYYQIYHLRTNMEEAVYNKIVSDVEMELKPVYNDFGLNYQSPKRTIGEVLHPLIGISRPEKQAMIK